MESFFFGVDLQHCRDSQPVPGVHRVDVSGGLVYLNARNPVDAHVPLYDRDRMVMMVFVQGGRVLIAGEDGSDAIEAGQIKIYTSRRQAWTIRFEHAVGFVLFVADFFMKRYVRAGEQGVLEQLHGKIEAGGALTLITTHPLDALSLYLIDRVVTAPRDEPMGALLGEHRVIELMIHRLKMLGFMPEGIDAETQRTVIRAKAILEAEFVDPPTIEVLARRCATNATKLKKLFKQVYHTTLYGYVQRLRMEEANLLLRQERLSIGEVALRVGYRHQGHFSRIFYETYGIYPKTLK